MFKPKSNTGSLLPFPRKPAANDGLMNLEEVKVVGIDQRRLYRLVDERKISSIDIGRRTFYLRSDVMEQVDLIKRSCQPAEEEAA